MKASYNPYPAYDLLIDANNSLTIDDERINRQIARESVERHVVWKWEPTERQRLTIEARRIAGERMHKDVFTCSLCKQRIHAPFGPHYKSVHKKMWPEIRLSIEADADAIYGTYCDQARREMGLDKAFDL
jgi:hypothetical protein